MPGGFVMNLYYLLTVCCVLFTLLRSRTSMVFENFGESSVRCIISGIGSGVF